MWPLRHNQEANRRAFRPWGRRGGTTPLLLSPPATTTTEDPKHPGCRAPKTLRPGAFRKTLMAYAEGRRGARAVARLARDYRGPCGHLLWDHDEEPALPPGRRWYLYDCLELLSGPQMVELIGALLDVDPGFPDIRSEERDLGPRRARVTFLGAALGWRYERLRGAGADVDPGRRHDPGGGPAASGPVLILLATPGTTRRTAPVHWFGTGRGPPLHQACMIPRIDPAFVHHLLDVDPDVLVMEDDYHRLPLERAVEAQDRRRPGPFISRMMELRPASLRHVSAGRPPWESARPYPTVWRQPVLMSLFESSNVAAGQLALAVALAPDAVRRGTSRLHSTALELTIERNPDRGLVTALVEAFPQALCLAKAIHSNGARVVGPLLLPHERAANEGSFRLERLAPMLRREFVHVALAVVEHLHFATGFLEDPEGAGAADFQRRVQDTVAAALSLSHASFPRASSCASGVVRAIQDLPEDRQVDLLSSLFRHHEDAIALSRDDPLRDAVMGDVVMGLYRMNRHGGGRSGGRRADPCPHHQVQLLSLASDTGSLDCVYLQLRQHGLSLVQHAAATRSSRLGQAAVSEVAVSTHHGDAPQQPQGTSRGAVWEAADRGAWR